MEYNEFMFPRPRGYDEEEDDSPNLTWGGLREDLPFLNPNLPDCLVEDIIWKHLSSQPLLRRAFELRLVSKRFRKFLTDPDSLRRHPIHESCLIKEKCVQQLGCQHRNGNVRWGAQDVLQGRVMPIPISSSSTTLPCKDPTCTGSEWSSFRPEWTDGCRVSSGQGGDPGLMYVVKSGASASASNSRIGSSSITEWVALNPVTNARRQLPFACLGRVPAIHFLWSVDKFSSGYVSWGGDGGEQMYPLLLDLLSNAWKRIGFGFSTRSRIRVDKAVQNGFVYLRYEKQTLKHLLIVYDIRQGRFCEKITSGLSRNIREELIFQDEGHVYLAAAEGYMIEKNVVVYELNSAESMWMPISRIPATFINFYPALLNLTFFHIGHELVVARLVTTRRTDGVHIFPSGRSTCATVSYDLTTRTWRLDEPGRLPPDYDFRTTGTSVFRPSLHTEV